MFDKTFFKFALGFTAIVALSMGAIYISGRLSSQADISQTTATR